MLAQANTLGLSRSLPAVGVASGHADQAGADRRWLDLVPTLLAIAAGLGLLIAVPIGLALLAYRALGSLVGLG